MILPESRNLEWIEKASADNHASNPILVEKVIRAFSLLEELLYIFIFHHCVQGFSLSVSAPCADVTAPSQQAFPVYQRFLLWNRIPGMQFQHRVQ